MSSMAQYHPPYLSGDWQIQADKEHKSSVLFCSGTLPPDRVDTGDSLLGFSYHNKDNKDHHGSHRPLLEIRNKRWMDKCPRIIILGPTLSAPTSLLSHTHPPTSLLTHSLSILPLHTLTLTPHMYSYSLFTCTHPHSSHTHPHTLLTCTHPHSSHVLTLTPHTLTLTPHMYSPSLLTHSPSLLTHSPSLLTVTLTRSTALSHREDSDLLLCCSGRFPPHRSHTLQCLLSELLCQQDICHKQFDLF